MNLAGSDNYRQLAGKAIKIQIDRADFLFGGDYGAKNIKRFRGLLNDFKDKGVSNSEVGMRPPAHRGLGLRPGGKWERKKVRSWEGGKLRS
jgi:hypothetical protein